jgi:outer membrane protein assembly factor BamB
MTGEELLRGIGDLCYTSPYVSGETVWFVGADADHSKPNTATAWRLVADGAELRAERLWDFEIDTLDRIYGEPVLAGSTLLAVTRNRTLLALDASTGKVLHFGLLSDSGGEVWASPTLVAGIAWVPDINGNMYAIETVAPFGLREVVSVSANASTPMFVEDGVVWRGEQTLVRYRSR